MSYYSNNPVPAASLKSPPATSIGMASEQTGQQGGKFVVPEENSGDNHRTYRLSQKLKPGADAVRFKLADEIRQIYRGIGKREAATGLSFSRSIDETKHRDLEMLSPKVGKTIRLPGNDSDYDVPAALLKRIAVYTRKCIGLPENASDGDVDRVMLQKTGADTRRSLGLPENASDDEVQEALWEAVRYIRH